MQKTLPKIILFLLFFIFLFSISTFILKSSVLALEEEFDISPLNGSLWQIYQNSGEIDISSGKLRLSAGHTTSFPFIHSKVNPIPPSGDFTIKFRIKFNEATTKGSGLALSTVIPQNGRGDILVSDPLFSKCHFLEVWQDSLMGFFFAYSGDCYDQSCLLDQILVYKKGSVDLNYHLIEFRYSDNRYLLFFDGASVFVSDPTQVRPTILWLGNYTSQGAGNTWSGFEIDYIHIYPLTPLNQPLILLPGLGASWNHEAMVLGIEKPQCEWYMTPGIKVYEGIIQTLQNANYELNKNLFVFNYDWTKPINLIVRDLKDYIEKVVDPPQDTKIDLIGHSLGGLVARTYVQNNPDNSVDRLISLGSPHYGVPLVYYVWEGGNLNRALNQPWERIGASLLLHLRKSGFSTTKAAVNSTLPIFKDLLPTFPYLRMNGVEKSINEMMEKNDWLINLNNPIPSHLYSLLNTFAGVIPDSTLRWIQIENRNWLDEILNLWPDGKPNNQEENANGDRTVLEESAQLHGANVIILENLNHRDLVETVSGQQEIFNLLELSPTKIIPAPKVTYEPSLVFQLASPGALLVFDSNGSPIGFGDDKMIVIPGAPAGEYQIKINGTGNGKYNLHIGQIVEDNDIWTTTSGIISLGDEINYQIKFEPFLPLKNPLIDKTGEHYKSSAQVKIENLESYINSQKINWYTKKISFFYLNRASHYLRQDVIKKSIIYLYRLHRLLSHYQSKRMSDNSVWQIKNEITGIISDLECAFVASKSGIYSQSKLNREIYIVERLFAKMKKKIKQLSSQNKATPEQGVLYSLSEEKLSQAKSSSSYEAHIKALSAKYLSLEGIFLFR